jgi:PAS domain S-box-containing protein
MSGTSRKGKEVLIVEDDPIIANLIKTFLKQREYLVINIVNSGEDALYTAVTSFPDIILMDINLFGKIDGITATRLITTMLKIPVLFVSAQDDDETFARASVAEPSGFIIKPFTGKDLYSNIEIALRNNETIRNQKNYDPGPFRKLLRNSLSALDAYFILDQNGRILFLNPYAEQILGSDRYEPIMVSINRYLTFRDTRSNEQCKDTFREIVREAATIGPRHYFGLVMVDGSVRQMSVAANMVHNSNDEIMGYLVRVRRLKQNEIMKPPPRPVENKPNDQKE